MSDERADRPADLQLRACRLREALAEGRLTVEEFSERLGPVARRDGGHRRSRPVSPFGLR